ncbi:low affinity iron permease family protein [Rhizobium grahamii]|uniref:Low affinity iron permease family protein n=1 Tax=Rhizobium grahamii TaxID=1120045 RepID=A0A370KH58_9HYPH|nr:low affinity iron permease family protein [Rhizobium grahamii]RDJ04279.1 hypothetical protein B5K06_27815 [Rhizobium grahamii]
MKTGRTFLAISEAVVWLTGHRLVVAAAVVAVMAWCLAGCALGLPRQWFVLSNMTSTLMTLFILLIIQHSQNRDMAALQVKIDELIRSSDAGNHMIGIERLEAEDLDRLADDR